MNNEKDVIIIGAGIAGLYAGYKILKQKPEYNILLLEKNDIVGGRMGNEIFYGTEIEIGAGIGRFEKDVLLKKLLKDFEIKNFIFTADLLDKSKNPISVMSVITRLRSEYRKKPVTSTFRDFAIEKIGKKDYERFLVSSGYTDYEKEDLYETLYHYGMEDNEPGWKGIAIPWNDLLDALSKKIGVKNILTKQTVVKIIHRTVRDTGVIGGVGFEVITEKGAWNTKKIILATTIDSVNKLLNVKGKDTLYDHVKGQPFLRVYGKFIGESVAIMKEYVSKQVFVEGKLHRIIPMNHKMGVYMIVYTDNQGAVGLKKYIENTDENRRSLCHLIEKALGLQKDVLEMSAIRSFYWDIGTHYYTPLDKEERKNFIQKIQHPCSDMWVVGECVSHNQGWVEGALESVEKVCAEW